MADAVSSQPGHLLLPFLSGLGATTGWIVASAGNAETGYEWRLAGSIWSAVVTIDPRRWIGMAFEARDPVAGRRAGYDINTDLYDVVRDRDFTDRIEADIVEFLDNIRAGRLLRGNDGAKFVLTFPLDGAQVRVARGLLGCTAFKRATMPAGAGHVPVT